MDVFKALTQFPAGNFDVDWGEDAVRYSPHVISVQLSLAGLPRRHLQWFAGSRSLQWFHCAPTNHSERDWDTCLIAPLQFELRNEDDSMVWRSV